MLLSKAFAPKNTQLLSIDNFYTAIVGLQLQVLGFRFCCVNRKARWDYLSMWNLKVFLLSLHKCTHTHDLWWR